MFKLFSFKKKPSKSHRNSGPSTGPHSDDSTGDTRDGRRRQLLQQVTKVVVRSDAGLKAGLAVMRVKAIPTDVGGYEFVVLVDLNSLPSPDVLHLLDGKIARRAREKLGLSVRALYWRGVEAPQLQAVPVEVPVATGRTVLPDPPRQPSRSLPAPIQVDFSLSSPADLHLQELGLSRPAPLAA